MTSAIDNSAGLQALISGDGDTFANKAAFYNSSNAPQDIEPIIPLSTFIGLANLVYSALPAKDTLLVVNGTAYTVKDSVDKPSGYQGMLLFDPTTNSYFVVDRGTLGGADLFTDAEMAITGINNQWSDALALANEAATDAAASGSTVYAVGHSLGGSLAQMQAADFGWMGYTFNAYGASDVFNQLGLTLNSHASIKNYRTLFDVVSDASTHLGDQPITLESTGDVKLLASGSSASRVDLIHTIASDHLLKNFFTATSDTPVVNKGLNHVYNEANMFSAPASGQMVALAEDLVSGLALGLKTAIPILGALPVGDLTAAQLAAEAWQYINDQSVSGITAIIPSDASLLSNALDASVSNNIDRASLAALSPVVLQGVDTSTLSNFGLWAPGQTTGLTKEYLVARNDMVLAKIAMAGAGQVADGSVSTDIKNTYVYSDLSRSPSPLYTVNGQGGNTYDVVFANNTGDGLTAAPGAYAELFGGAGNDILFGGTVNSTLEGGAGYDDYIIDGDGTGVDSILDTDGQGKVEWKSGGTSQILAGGNEVAGTSAWKSADGSITYFEDIAADGSTELEITSKNKIAYIDNFTNGEFGITLNIDTPVSQGSSNLAQLRDSGVVGNTSVSGEASHVYSNDLSGATVDSIYGADSSGSSYGNELLGEGNAHYIYAGNGSNIVLLGDFYRHATDPLLSPMSATIQGGSGDQQLIGVGNGTETITGGAAGADTSAVTYIDGGGATAFLAGGGQNSVIFGGTGADTLVASSAVGASGFNPYTMEIAGLSFYGDVYSSLVDGDGKSYELASLPKVSWLETSPDNAQFSLSLYQSDGTYGAPIGLLGSSLNSGASDGASSLPGSLLIGGTGEDWLIGNRGNDTLIGGNPLHAVNGVPDEVLVGGAGADVIYGGGGTEIIYADMSPGAVSNWANLDPGSADTIYGGTGTDFIYGSGGKDAIYGGAGTNVIHAGNGGGYIDTGSGNSSVYGGSGNDTIVADGTSNYIQAGGGNAYIEAARGNSTIITGAGDDTIQAAGGNTLVTEGSGHTTLIAGTSTGSDTIQPSSGGTTVQLIDGLTESTLIVRDVNGDLVLSDPGFDTQVTVSGYFNANTGVSLQFADSTTWGTPEILQAAIKPRSDGGNDTLVGSNGSDSIAAGYGDTSIVGTSGNNTLTGGAGDDTIQGGSGSDTIEGGSGTTQILGGTGTETYVFNVGDGSDTIVENATTAGNDTLQLGAGIDESDVTYAYDSSSNDLLINFGSASASTITVGGLVSTQADQHQIATIEFADGTTLTQLQVIQQATAIVGTTGNDSLTGNAGINYFDGNGGDDVEVGGGGNDTFVFNSGYGQLEVNESYTSDQQPVLLLGAGITSSALHLTGSGDNLILTDGVQGDQITLDGMLSSSTDGVASVQLADGTTLSAAQLLQMEMTGTTGNDALYGTTGADLFDGKGGNDVEVGNGGSDTFVFNAGYGDLEINEAYASGQQPILQLGAGITAAALKVAPSSSGSSLILTDSISGDQITLDNAISSNGSYGVQEVAFADGTTLTAAQLIQMAHQVSGTTGNDTLYGTTDAELLDGKGGNDVEVGNGGSDTFVFNAGYGQLEINEAYTNGQLPILQLGAGITASALKVTPSTGSGSSLILTDGISGDQISLDNAISSNGSYGVQEVALADGTTLTAAQLIQMSQEISGTTGNDTLYGTSGADLIDGKGGNDLELGYGGNDTFVFDAGYGQLAIGESYTSGQQPILQLGAGITAANLHVATDSDNLFLTDGIAGDEINLESMWSTDGYGVAAVRLADGTMLTRDQLLQMGTTTVGTTGNDTIYGTPNAELFDGMGGNDYVSGGGGNDTFVFNAGYGQLSIYEDNDPTNTLEPAGTFPSGAQPVLQLGAGITLSTLRVTLGNGITLTDGISGDQVSLGEEGIYGDYGVAAVQFADGTTLTAAQLIALGHTITGTTGNDTLYVSAGDTIDGLGGSDLINGSRGVDTVVFNPGYGQLEINQFGSTYSVTYVPYAGNHTVVQLGAGITASMLHVTVTPGQNNAPNTYGGYPAPGNIVITDGISGDRIALDNLWNFGTGTLQCVQFADGTSLTLAQLESIEISGGTTGNDTIYGTLGADLIDGKGGNDTVYGSGLSGEDATTYQEYASLPDDDDGSDTFVFNAGYGHLEITDQYSTSQPVLQLGQGITASSLHVASNGPSLILTDGISGDQITLSDMMSGATGWGSTWGVAGVQFADGTTLTAAQLVQMEIAGGTTGNDTLYGTSGAETLDGKGGNDVINGMGGNDTFVFNEGYGQLAINESYLDAQQPVLQLGAGITAAALRVTSDGTSLFLTDGISGDQITLEDALRYTGQGVQLVTFADGTSLTASQLTQMEMTGTTGNDTLYGTSGADLIDGKGGNDLALGEDGNDTFVFNAGYGHLEITEVYSSDQTSVLQLGTGITASTLHVAMGASGKSLILTDDVSGDQITLDLMANTSNTYGVETVQFADGSTLTSAQLVALVNHFTGSVGNDTLFGTTGADVFDGKGGNDVEIGNGGNDTFVFNTNYGSLEINEIYKSGQTPVLQLSTGITSSTLKVTGTTDGTGLVLTDGVSGDQVTLDNALAKTGTNGVATVQLADGTTLTAAQLVQEEITGGTAGSDTLYGTSGAETLDGKGGNDVVVGMGGNDTFVFNTSYGHLDINEIYKSGQTPVLQLGTGITASTLKVTATTDGTGLVLTDGVSGDQVTLDNALAKTGTNGVATVKLGDGMTLTAAQLVQKEITGGTTGNDTLYGTSGAETLDGKGGNDVVVGKGGSDTFVFNQSYGHLEINETYSGTQAPVLQLGTGITATTLKVTASSGGTGLVLTDGVSGDLVTLDNALVMTGTNGVAKVKLGDGTTLTAAQLVQKEIAGGTTGNDTLYGTSGAETLDGKGGNDVVVGKGGNDTFVFNQSYGHLEINELYASGQAPVLKLGTGITTSTLKVTATTDGTGLVLTDGVSGDQITLDNALANTGSSGVATVKLADGTTLTAAQLVQMKSANTITKLAVQSSSTNTEDLGNINYLVHAIAGYMGNGSGEGTVASPMTPPTSGDLMLHAVA